MRSTPIRLSDLWPRRPAGTALPPGQRELQVFPRFADDPRRPLPPVPAEATLTVAGAVRREVTFAVAQLPELVPTTSLTADFHCVTTWSVRDLTWAGVLFAEFWREVVVPRCEPEDDVRGIVVRGLDGVQAVVRLDDALQPDVLLADRLEGAALSATHGAPLRFVSPGQYGYKSIKHLCRIELYRDTPPSTYGAKEHPRARVAFEERHSRIPGTALRWPYRLAVPVTAALAERTGRRS
ncbi:molybdopterin-dependent oxidoreductase [Planomonospora sp. ID67723]|uniref:molybdopterin-dependent oxidoreductase n=1 Tax=Planomonospora sp. ID67723 TaxID=2738134 RepID=UPI0018C449BB|nr:molybdopterin-dependent oxidoreductase [Planomonospora sp. ID67723]MBG0826358.1 molybdopterin-dependent oxidoreductase [Planomonospora sp. ID67723]